MKFTEFILPLCFLITGISNANAACSYNYFERANDLMSLGGIASASTTTAATGTIIAGSASAIVAAPVAMVGAVASVGVMGRGIRIYRLGLALTIAEGNEAALTEREVSIGESALQKLTNKVNRHSSREVSYDEVVNILKNGSLNNDLCPNGQILKSFFGFRNYILDQI